MTIKCNLDRVMFEKGNITVAELERRSSVNKNTLHSLYKNKATRYDAATLDRVCKALDCQPGDLLEYVAE